ncbi:hypothetical protein EDC44_1268 [Cricetibacter osteomyelitidis]|uniref:Uncharacterized protein n=1 Tax=Cricetibacter osteomyelitidis TaxID=1521931 RepID=A0A4R2T4X9_9PAST|nr:hypothetical protein [Cricetibacter osteomyelitidis]TCP92128.1 hypothetical protein EDC44_1268 [Cricetibacter osteomyelitidis]
MLAHARVTANLLATARYIGIANIVFFVLATKFGGGLLPFQILIASTLLYLHVRVYFDQQLFVDLAYHHLTTEELDRSLDELNLKKSLGNRPLEERVEGALRLWRYTVYATGAQILLFFLQS